ncbi:MAG: hypothetical protein LBG22_01990 [Treponema sp.]|nr:hypothetical protein [Treponema sp.]
MKRKPRRRKMEFHPLSELEKKIDPETLERPGSSMSIRIFTLIDYLDSLGMRLEIVALPKGKNTERELLLKV